MIKIQQTVETLSRYLKGARQQGHTTAMLTGLLHKTPRPLTLLVADAAHKSVLKFNVGNVARDNSLADPKPKLITLNAVDNLIGRTGPLLVDNYTLSRLLDDIEEEFKRLNYEISRRDKRLSDIRKLTSIG